MNGPLDVSPNLSPEPGEKLDFKTLLRETLDWIPKKAYMDLYGETADVINKRCRPGGGWKRGVHFNKPEGGGIWISIKAVNAWAATQAKS